MVRASSCVKPVNPRGPAIPWALLAGIAAVLPLAAGCDPTGGSLFDAKALLSARRVVVLPMVDAPGPDGKGAGKVVPGVIVSQLLRMGRYDVVHVSPKALNEALSRTGYDLEDCYDPVVSAALAAELRVDAAVCGELAHYGAKREHTTTVILIAGGGGTETTHWVSLSVRIVKAGEGKIIYTGAGTASSKEGYTSAAKVAAGEALASLRRFLKKHKP